jgi:hypothetical protein
MPEPGADALFTNAASAAVGTHDIILQSLDSWRDYKHPDGTVESLFYGSDVFKGTESEWESVPVILGERHPTTPYKQNPAKALEEAGGKVIGNLSGVHITESGSPLLRSNLHITDDDAETLLKSRKIALSSGFLSGKQDGKLTGVSGKVLPDHVLAFVQNRNNRPQDGAALILNSMEENMTDDESIKKVLSDFLSELKSLIVPAKNEPVMPAMPEPKGNIMVSNMTDEINELKSVIEEQKSMIANMSAEIDAFKKADEERAKQAIEDEWTLVKNSIAPGLYSTPEIEAKSRAEWEVSPSKFILNNSTKAEETTKDGVPFVTNATGNSQAESDAEYLKFLNGDE